MVTLSRTKRNLMGHDKADYDYTLSFPAGFRDRPDVAHTIEVEHLADVMPPAHIWLLSDMTIRFPIPNLGDEVQAALRGVYRFMADGRLYHEGPIWRVPIAGQEHAPLFGSIPLRFYPNDGFQIILQWPVSPVGAFFVWSLKLRCEG